MRFARSAYASAGVLAPLAAPATGEPTKRDDTPVRGASSTNQMPSMPAMPRQATSGDRVTLALGGTLWRGDFGAATNSQIAVVVANARYRTGDLRLDATLPWMAIRSDGAVFTAIDGTPLVAARGVGTGRRTRRGLGDLTLGARWLALGEERFGADLELGARVKLPTARDRTGLSTGKVDYAVSAEASKRFGRAVPNARLTYRVFGDPALLNLRNGVATSVGSAYLFDGGTVLVGSYDYAERASAFIGDAHEASFGASTPVGSRLRFNASGSVGLSRSAPDFSAGVSLSLGVGR